MRPLPRLLLTATATLSTLLALASLTSWALSHRTHGLVARAPFAPAHTLAAQSGTLVLHRHPRATEFSPVVRQRIAYLRNADLTGTVSTTPGLPRTFTPRLANRSTWANFPRLFASTEYDAALLAALDDPDRFAAAHVALANRHATRARPNTAAVPTDTPGPATLDLDLDGLRLQLPAYAAASLDELSQRQRDGTPMPLTIDPTSQSRLRQLWQSRLVTPALSIPFWQLTLPLLLLPTLQAALTLRARRRAARARQGLCPTCAYDLRATPTRCPECGTVMPVTPA